MNYFLRWYRMNSYWPPAPATEGPEVLFAWRLDESTWQYGVGWGSWPLRGQPLDEGPLFWVGEDDITPERFAIIRPPED